MNPAAGPRVAYFCMEYGLDESFPIYSGGLGVLAGDFIRSAHALKAPVVAIGIAWAEGYTTQRITSEGRVEDDPTPLRRDVLKTLDKSVHVRIAGRDVRLQIHRVDAFDNVPLYLLEPTEPRDLWMTKRLYGGGKDDRIAQEIILGCGGVRALEAVGVPVDLYHFNEGHAVFAGLELLRKERQAGKSFEDALTAVKPKIVFTTHTPVPAGNEEHSLKSIETMEGTLGHTRAELIRIGGDPFNMTVAALRMSHLSNAVAELHAVTAQEMWKHVDGAARIIPITNGVDHRIWQDPAIRDAKNAAETARAHAVCKRALLDEIARRSNVKFDEKVLTIGFARRATAYKRATLLFHDRARIAKLLEAGKLQLVYAGKSHPRDTGGRKLIGEIIKLSKKFPGRVVFLENYDLKLGRLLTRGCDIWLNNPRRPLEACGTSGMKAAMNGVLNVSILDGWWPEGCVHGENGWRIGDDVEREEAPAEKHDAEALYRVIETEVIPTYYDAPAKWTAMSRASTKMSVGQFSSDRMVSDYFAKLYAKAVRA